MSFTIKETGLLTACARAIIADNHYTATPNLYSFSHFFIRGDQDEIVYALAARVEVCSNGSMTIRPADKSLFADRLSGPDNLYLVLCEKNIPEGVVTELTDDMVLIRFGPYVDGLRLGVARASREEIAANTEYLRVSWLQNQALVVVREFLVTLSAVIKRYAVENGSPEIRAELDSKLRYPDTVPTIETLAYFAAALDVSIWELVSYAQKADH